MWLWHLLHKGSSARFWSSQLSNYLWLPKIVSVTSCERKHSWQFFFSATVLAVKVLPFGCSWALVGRADGLLGDLGQHSWLVKWDSKSRLWQECKQRVTTLQLLVCLSSPFWRGTDAAWKLFKIFSKSIRPDSEENPVISFSLFCICSGSNTTNNYTRNVSTPCQTGISWKSLIFWSGSPFFLLFLPWEWNKQHIPADESHEASKFHIQHWRNSFISISIFSWYEVVKPQISVRYAYLLCLLIWAEKSIVVKQPVKQIIVLSLAAYLTVSNAGQHQTHHQSW